MSAKTKNARENNTVPLMLATTSMGQDGATSDATADEARRSTLALVTFYADHLLRNRESVYDGIANRIALAQSAAVFLLMGVLFGGFYGATMGLHLTFQQVLAAAVKVPLLLALALAVAAPALYTFNTLLGSRMRLDQVLGLCAATFAVSTVLLLALSPLSIFLTVTGTTYSVLKLFHVGVFFVSGYFGAFFLYEGMQTIAARLGQDQNLPILQIWLCLYAFLGCLMAWVLRPFVGDIDQKFAMLRHLEGNFFRGVMDAVMNAIR